MKKFGFASIVASGLAAAVLGLAAPAQAGLGHNIWVNQNGPSVTVPAPTSIPACTRAANHTHSKRGTRKAGAPLSFR